MTSPATEQIGVGSIVADTYRIVGLLGRGGMGTVWEAEHMRLPGKQVAIKVLHNAVSENTEALARFRREAEIACRLGHPNIVEVHDFNKLDNGCPYLILELLEGQDLEARLRQEGLLDLDSCDNILRQVGSALQSAHQSGVIHRDLKPQNIFLVPSPTGVGPEVVKVLDFGISKIHGSNTVQTQNSTLLGTPQYMAPEQACGDHDKVDGRTDLFALAAMLYELVTGRAAFPGQSIPEVIYKVVHGEPKPLSEIAPDLPTHKAAAIHKALNKAQDDRFATVGDFVEAFTGSPLPAARVRRSSMAPSMAPSMAVAETIDSANLAGGVLPDLAIAATIDSQSIRKSGVLAKTDIGGNTNIASAETVDSQQIEMPSSGPPSETLDAGSLSSGPLNDSLMTNTQTFSGIASMGKILLGAGLAGAIVFLLMRSGSDSQSTRPATAILLDAGVIDSSTKVAVVTSHDATPPLALVVDAAVDELAGDASPIKSGAKSASNDSRQNNKRQAAQTVELQPKVSSEYTALLKKAGKSLNSGQPKETLKLLREAVQMDASPRLYELTSKAHCLLKAREDAMTTLRKLNKSRRAKVLTYCADHGFEIHER